MSIRSSLVQTEVAVLIAATAISLGLYSSQALLLLLKLGEVLGGVFDTSVPAFPLAGMLFVLIFIALRRKELERLMRSGERKNWITATGVVMTFLPLLALRASGSLLSGSYVFAAIALTTCWVGVMVALRPSVFRFFIPYLLFYVAAIGSVSLLTSTLGDPLAAVVASISEGVTTAAGLPVHWSSVYMTFVAAGGSQVSLYISQECSGIASVSIFLLLMGLMYLDLKPRAGTAVLTAALGFLLFVILNSLRVVTIIVGGIYGGTDLLWNLHGWVGYVYYIIGYAAILLFFTGRIGKETPLKPKSLESV